jgi:putative RecB family exonuclease
MKIEALRNEPHISVSSIQKYIDCSLQYKFSKIDKLSPEFVSDNLVFGSSIHQALAEFNQERLSGIRMKLEDLKALFADIWHQKAYENPWIKYSTGKNYQSLSNLGQDMLEVYYRQLSAKEFTIISIEEPFKFEIDGLEVPMIGIMDLVEQDDHDGSIVITEYKTAAKAYGLDDVNRNFQLTVYDMAARRNGYAGKEIVFKLDTLLKTKSPRFEQFYTTRDENDEARAIRKIKSVWEGIQKQIFIPNDTSWKCINCEYRTYCDNL